MRTNIDIDDELMAQAMAATGAATKRAVVEEALRLVVQIKRQEGIGNLFGKVRWEGNLDEMRTSRFPNWDEERGQEQGIANTPAA